MIRVYTSCTKSYLPKARVVAHSLKEHHPDYFFLLVFSDSLPRTFNLENEPFDAVLTIDDMNIEDKTRWIFTHNVVELCTAVKGYALKYLLSMENTDAVFYLDPDIWVLSSFDSLVNLFKQYDILLTPHILAPETEKWEIHAKEIVTTLAHGVFNLGFIGIKNSPEGHAFAEWWKQRLMYFCYDDVPLGIFTDQRWCDLAPIFFPSAHIVRDKGCNVATWNITHRPITRSGETFYADNEPIKFYHFTGFDAGRNFSDLLLKHAEEHPAALDLWNAYGDYLKQHGHSDESLKHWKYEHFANGKRISAKSRQVYRDNHELQENYPDPFAEGESSYYDWCNSVGLLNEDSDSWTHERYELESKYESQIENLHEDIDRIYNSFSWKITMPLRQIKRLFS